MQLQQLVVLSRPLMLLPSMITGDCCSLIAFECGRVSSSLYINHVVAVADDVNLQAGTATAAGVALQAADVAA